MSKSFEDKLYSNPMALAGLGVMSGKDLGTALNEAAVTSRQHQVMQAEKAQFEQQQYMRENIGQLMSQIDPNDLQGSFATLVKAGVPIPNASALVDSFRKQQAQTQMQEFMASRLGGGAASGADIAAYGAFSNNPALVNYGFGVMDRNESKPPQGYRKNADGSLSPIPGAPQGKQDPSLAAKTTLLTQGKRLANEAFAELMGDGGRINNQLLAGVITNAAGTEGRRIRRKLKTAVRNKLRIESGASISDQETESELDQVLPSIFDSEETKQDKLRELATYFNTASSATSPKQEIAPEVATPQKDKQSLSEMAAGDESIDSTLAQEAIQTGESIQNGISQEDLEFTAQKHGISVDEVRKRLGM